MKSRRGRARETRGNEQLGWKRGKKKGKGRANENETKAEAEASPPLSLFLSRLTTKRNNMIKKKERKMRKKDASVGISGRSE